MLYDKLKRYSISGIYPFHMPGHKRNFQLAELPYDIDLTEIYGFDNLHNASGCIKAVADKAARLYDVSLAYMLVNGATGGILSAIRAMTNSGDTIIMARNCHKSVYNAAELCRLRVKYILPETNKEYGIFSSVTPKQVEKALACNTETKLVVITSPTYEGVVSDIKEIAKICQKYGARLFVDEAHGAHFSFSGRFPFEAVNCGANAAVVSLHKTLPSLTQTALLLTNDKALGRKLEDNLSVFETSSPSYILMSSIEKCLDFVENKNNFNTYLELLDEFYKKCLGFQNLKILYNDFTNSKTDFYDLDISKIVISLLGTDITGTQFAKILRENYNIEIEMAYSDYVIAMTSVCDTKEGLDRLYFALAEIDKIAVKNYSIIKPRAEFTLPQYELATFEKDNFITELVDFKCAENRISAEYIWAYPPGIPITVPGEKIGKSTFAVIDSLTKSGVEVYSSNKNMPKLISVVKTV